MAFTYRFYRQVGLLGVGTVVASFILGIVISPLLINEDHSAFLALTLLSSVLAFCGAMVAAQPATPILLIMSASCVFSAIPFFCAALLSFVIDMAVCLPLSNEAINGGHSCISSGGRSGSCSVLPDSQTALSEICLEFHYGSGLLGRLAHASIGICIFTSLFVIAALTVAYVKDWKSLCAAVTVVYSLLVINDAQKNDKAVLKADLRAMQEAMDGGTKTD